MKRLQFDVKTVSPNLTIDSGLLDYVTGTLIEMYPFLDFFTTVEIESTVKIVSNVNESEYQKFKLLGGEVSSKFSTKLPLEPVLQVSLANSVTGDTL